jgi:hypothetical protein
VGLEGLTTNPPDQVARVGTEEREAPEPATEVAPESRASRSQWVAAIAILGLVGVVVPVFLASKYGALGIVRNDDWSYLRTLFTWVDTGRLDFNNWVSMTLLSQLALAAPAVVLFGNAITVVQLETAALGLVGLAMVVWIGNMTIRRFGVATFVAVMVAAGPLWGALAVSYMTDVPAFAVSMVAVALGVRALRDRPVSLLFLIASAVVGVLGFTIRQYAAVPPIAIAAIGGFELVRERSRPRLRVFVISCVVLLAAAGVFWAYWRTIPHPKAYSPEMPSGHSIRATLYKGTAMVRLTALLVLPALALCGPVKIVRRAWATARDTTIFVAVGVTAVLWATAAAAPSIAFAGNYIVPDGILANGVVAGRRPDVFPSGVFNALVILATAAATLLALALVPWLHTLPERFRHRRFAPTDRPKAFIALVVAGYVAAYFLASFTGIPLYDRYVLPAVPLVAVLLLAPTSETLDIPARTKTSTRLGALVALCLLAAVGFVYTADSASFDGARWQTAVAATKQGWTRKQIRGGFEWTNFYAARRISGKTKYCVKVVLNPKDGINEPRVIAHSYYHSPLHGAVPVVAIRTKLPCTPGRAAPSPSRR